MLPFSRESESANREVMLQGVELDHVIVPLHTVYAEIFVVRIFAIIFSLTTCHMFSRFLGVSVAIWLRNI